LTTNIYSFILTNFLTIHAAFFHNPSVCIMIFNVKKNDKDN